MKTRSCSRASSVCVNDGLPEAICLDGLGSQDNFGRMIPGPGCIDASARDINVTSKERCTFCGRLMSGCDCSDFDVAPEMGAR